MDKEKEAAAMEALPQLLGPTLLPVSTVRENFGKFCVARKDLSLKDGQTLMATRCCKLVGHSTAVSGYLYIVLFLVLL